MLTPPFDKIRPFSTRFRQDINEVSESALTWEEERESILSRLERIEGRLDPIASFPAMLNIAKLIPSQTNRWAYGWEEFMPGIAPSAFGFPGCGAGATATPSTWVFTPNQSSSWGSNTSSDYAATHPYHWYAINLAEIHNSEVAAGADGYVSYGQKVGAGPAGTGTVSLLSIGNVADTTAENRRNVIVNMNAYLLPAKETGTNFYNAPKLYPNDAGKENGYKHGVMFAFSAGNEVEVSCS